jgi:hypothetical protein
MKKFWFFSLIFIILGVFAWGQGYTWSGNTAPTTDIWADNSEWNNQPVLGDDVENK